MITITEIEFDAKKKNAEWFWKVLFDVFPMKRYLIDRTQAEINRSYSLGTYSTVDIQAKIESFVGEEMSFGNKPNNTTENVTNTSSTRSAKRLAKKSISFVPIAILDNYRNIIVNEIAKQPLIIRTRCYDSSITEKMKKDIVKKKVEQSVKPIFDKLAKGIGIMPPKGFPPKQEDGSPTYTSNMDVADQMGLDMNNPEDEKLYTDVFQKQIWQCGIETGVNSLLDFSQGIEQRKQLVEDYFDWNAVSGQTYFNSYSQLPQFKKLDSYFVWYINGKMKNLEDADAKGYDMVMKVSEFLGKFGQDIQDESELLKILTSANISSGTTWTGIQGIGSCVNESGLSIDQAGTGWCSWNTFMNLGIMVGYAEMKSQNLDRYEYKVDGSVVKQGADFIPATDAGSKLDDRFYQVTYSGWYLQNNFYRVYGFKIVPEAERKGMNGQTTNFSIQTYREGKPSLAEKSIYYVDRFFEYKCKFEWFMNRAKPSGYSHDIHALKDVARALKGIDGAALDPNILLRVLENSIDSLHASVMVDGKTIGGNAAPFYPITRGVDPSVKDILMIMKEMVQEISEITGINRTRIEANPNANEGFKVAQLQIERSVETTYFIEDGIRAFFGSVGGNMAWNIQWIIGNKSKLKTAYGLLVDMIGQDNCDAIESIGLKNLQMFDISFIVPMTAIERKELKDWTTQLALKGAISTSMKFQIDNIEDYRKAQMVLVYAENQQAKKIAAAAQSAQSAPLQLEQLKGQNDLAKINAKGMWDVKMKSTVDPTMVEVEKLKLGMEIPKIQAKADAKIQEKTHGAVLDEAKSNTDFQRNAILSHQDHQQNLEAQSAAQPPSAPAV